MSQMPSRRKLLKGGLIGLPLAAALADPRLARALADGLSEQSIPLPNGRVVNAALALPDTRPAPAVLLVHEWWGLNDQIKTMARALADAGYVALAIDLYDGKLAEDPDSARAYMQAVKADEAQRTLDAWVAWLRAHDAVEGGIGTVGWCFGGGWSLSTGVGSPVEATVVYYGRVTHPEAELAKLKGPVLGHFATADTWIDKKMVAGFEARMTALGKAFTFHWYEAGHAFANPTSGRYDQADAQLAWQRTLYFYKANL